MGKRRCAIKTPPMPVRKKKKKVRAWGPLRHKSYLRSKEKMSKIAQKIKDEIELRKGVIVTKVRNEY